MQSEVGSAALGSARVSRAGFGVSPKRSCLESSRTRDAFANARDGRATQNRIRSSSALRCRNRREGTSHSDAHPQGKSTSRRLAALLAPYRAMRVCASLAWIQLRSPQALASHHKLLLRGLLLFMRWLLSERAPPKTLFSGRLLDR